MVKLIKDKAEANGQPCAEFVVGTPPLLPAHLSGPFGYMRVYDLPDGTQLHTTMGDPLDKGLTEARYMCNKYGIPYMWVEIVDGDFPDHYWSLT